ncbi:MAG: ArnT family glycosyltransferase [Bradyrhizobium sp.]
MGQIVAGRLAMWMCLAGSVVLIYGLARRFVSHGGALFAALAYLSVSAIADHGASFRTDSLATFLALLSFYLMLRRPGGSLGAALAGVAMAVAMLVTIKSVFHLAALAVALLWLTPGIRDRARLAAAFAGVFGLVFAAGYLWHASALAEPEAGAATGFLGRTASKMLFEDGLLPRWKELLTVVILNPLFWLMTLMGAGTAWGWTRGKGGRDSRDGWLVLALALPLLTPLLYRNAFLYFYVFILPAASLLVGITFDKYLRRDAIDREAKRLPVAFLLLFAQCAFFCAIYALRLPDRTEAERVTIAGIHAVFPEPVPYIGGYGIAATLPRVGFFMSGWGLDSYRREGHPVFADLVAKTQPPLLLADSPALTAALIPGWDIDKKYALLPADIDYLRENYLPYWGMIFVAGKRLQIPAASDSVAFDIAVSGDYRLGSARPAVIDGQMREPGDVVRLAAGHHVLSGSVPGEAVLRWAPALPPPDTAPVDFMTFFDIRE